MEEKLRNSFTLLNVTGFLPEILKKTTRKWYYFRLFLLISVYCAALIYINFKKYSLTKNDAIAIGVDFVHFYGRIVMSIWCLCVINFHGDKLAIFFTNISRTSAFNSEQKMPFGNYAKIIFVSIIIKVLTQEIPLVFIHKYDLDQLIIHFALGLSLLALYLTNLLWTTCILLLLQSIHTSKSSLKSLKYHECWVVEDYAKLDKTSMRNLLKNSARAYDNLCSLNDLLNETFGPIIVTNVPLLFLEILHSIYSLCLMTQGEEEFKMEVVVFGALYLISFLEIVIPCITVNEECDKFVKEINKIATNISNSDDDLETSMRINIVLQTHHQKISFNANGIFQLDGSLVYSIFGAVTTYLIILLQFHA